jgi:hypothetical protein
LREGRRLRVFENRVLRRIFESKRDEVTGEWRKIHFEKCNNLYSLPNIFRVITLKIMIWAGHVARIGKSRAVYRVLVEKTDGKRPPERARFRWKDNIKIDHQRV